MEMIKLLQVSFRNFMSYGNDWTTVDLTTQGATLIVGQDLDNTTAGVGANGVGKTTIFNAIVYALYDKPISDITKDNLVNNINNKQMEVILDYIGKDGITYRIHRMRKMKAGAAGNDVVFYKEGVNITPDSLGATNIAIEATIGFPYELFVQIIVFTASNQPFLKLKTDQQKAFIEELFGLTIITKKAESLKKTISGTESSIKLIQVKIDALSDERERHATQIENAKKRVISWDATNKANIIELNEKLQRIGSVDINEQHDIHTQIIDIRKRIKEQNREEVVLNKAVTTFRQKIVALNDEINHLRDSTCPYCKQQFTDTAAKIDECFKARDELQIELAATTDDVAVVVSATEDLHNEIAELQSKLTVNDIDELLELRDQSSTIVAKINELTSAVNPYEEVLQELVDMKFTDIDYSDINAKTVELEHQKFLLKLLTKKDSFVRKMLVNRGLPMLNANLKQYLTAMNLPHSVEFTREMTATISRFGRSLQFGNLSQGQASRVNFALAMAFRDVLQSSLTPINVCMFDEVLDHGLDAIGVVAAANVLKLKAMKDNTCMFIISHKDEVSTIFEQRLVVQMKNGFSSIVGIS